MKSDTWMPFYVADYLRDTMHLSAEQHGAYLLLIMACWTRGGSLPGSDEQLAGIARMAPATWRKSRAVVMAFFATEGDGYTHKRVKAEIGRTQAVIDRRSKAGAKGAAGRWQTHSNRNADALPSGWQTDGQSQSQDRTLAPIGRESSIPDIAQPSPSPAEGQASAARSLGGPDKALTPQQIAFLEEQGIACG